MFEVNGKYANRKGAYTVVAINPPKMRVRYEDGNEADVNINIQERIWANLVAEQERADEKSRRRAQQNKHFIKVVSVPNPDDFSFPGWHERVIMVSDPKIAQTLKLGDRVIFYAWESKTFIAVATITGESFKKDPKDYFYTTDEKEGTFFPMDRDADSHQLEKGLAADSVDLDTIPNFTKLSLKAEMILPISEDDFELLAESLTEVSEEGDEDTDDDFEEEEDE